MKVSELVEALKTLPQDLEVAYINQCADEGQYTVTIDSAEIRTGFDSYWQMSFPEIGIVVLK